MPCDLAQLTNNYIIIRTFAAQSRVALCVLVAGGVCGGVSVRSGHSQLINQLA